MITCLKGRSLPFSHSPIDSTLLRFYFIFQDDKIFAPPNNIGTMYASVLKKDVIKLVIFHPSHKTHGEHTKCDNHTKQNVWWRGQYT